MKAYSLHVGLDKVEYPGHYTEPKELTCGVKDAISLKTYTDQSKMFDECLILIEDEATREKVFGHLDLLIKKCTDAPNEEFYFFFSITCHAQQVNTNFGGRDQKVEFLCLYDGMVLEHIFREKLAEFPSNAKIFILIGSCYAEGFITEHFLKETEGLFTCRDLPVQKKFIADYCQSIRDNYRKNFNYNASIIAFSATSESEGVMMGRLGDPSLFVHWFLRILGNKSFHANYTELYLIMKKYLPYQLMQIDTLGRPSYFFHNTPPVLHDKVIQISNFKSIHMSWAVNLSFLHEPPAGQAKNYMKAEIVHPVNRKHNGTIMNLTNDPTHGMIKDFPLDGYKKGDPIRLILFDEQTDTNTSVDLSIKDLIFEKDSKKYGHILVHDSAEGGVVAYKKSTREVNDAIGGGG